MNGTLRRRDDSQPEIMRPIASIAAADLERDEKDSTYNKENNNKGATASLEVHHRTS